MGSNLGPKLGASTPPSLAWVAPSSRCFSRYFWVGFGKGILEMGLGWRREEEEKKGKERRSREGKGKEERSSAEGSRSRAKGPRKING